MEVLLVQTVSYRSAAIFAVCCDASPLSRPPGIMSGFQGLVPSGGIIDPA